MVVVVIVVVVMAIVVVVVKMLVWDAARVNIVVVVEVLVIDVRADVVIVTLAGVNNIVLAAAFVIALEFAVSISDFAIMGFVTGIGVEVLADANGNVFASLMTALEFAVPKPFREFSC